MASSDATFWFGSTQVTVPVGATNAVLVTPLVFEEKKTLKLLSASGSSFVVIGATLGETLSAQSLASLAPFGYPMSVAETLNTAGPARFYMAALGATAVVAILTDRSQDS